MIRIREIPMALDYQHETLISAAAKRLRLPASAIQEIIIRRKSIDARKKNDVRFIFTVDVKTSEQEGKLISRLKNPRITLAKANPYIFPRPSKAISERPVVVGFGPAGMFAALVLARAGLKPIVLERGAPVAKRSADVQAYWKSGILTPESNVQFGEGGAGTFSDGKLTTGINDPRVSMVFEQLVQFGAPNEILYAATPHIGTDRLQQVVRSLRKFIESLGGEIQFYRRVVGIQERNGALTALSIQCAENLNAYSLPCTKSIFAIGHSARDTLTMLLESGVPLTPKPFSMGVRIEHPAERINQAQYGEFWNHPALGAADYKLSCHLANGRSVYSFCMCPGGVVVASASEPESIVTNGMSDYKRDARNSNAALLVNVAPDDFGYEGPLGGIHFQREWERLAYKVCGPYAPAQRVEDFLYGRSTSAFHHVAPSYQPGVTPTDLSRFLPNFVSSSLALAIPQLGRRFSPFSDPDAVLTGPETRSSSPVRILRNVQLQSPALNGFYPCGEGAGYAGGIVSAAVDGVKCAESLILGESWHESVH